MRTTTTRTAATRTMTTSRSWLHYWPLIPRTRGPRHLQGPAPSIPRSRALVRTCPRSFLPPPCAPSPNMASPSLAPVLPSTSQGWGPHQTHQRPLHFLLGPTSVTRTSPSARRSPLSCSATSRLRFFLLGRLVQQAPPGFLDVTQSLHAVYVRAAICSRPSPPCTHAADAMCASVPRAASLLTAWSSPAAFCGLVSTTIGTQTRPPLAISCPCT